MTNESTHCECPTERLYDKEEVCQYCRTSAFYDDPDYAEFMGFILVNGEWL